MLKKDLRLGDYVYALVHRKSYKDGKDIEWVQRIPGTVWKFDEEDENVVWVKYKTDRPHHFSMKSKLFYSQASRFPLDNIEPREPFYEEIE